jgi:hypothetical protein
VGAISFFVSGIKIAADPDCVTADFGGGRVSTITCRPDSLGSMSGTLAGFIALCIGGALLFLIYWKEFSNFLDHQNRKSFRWSQKRIETVSTSGISPTGWDVPIPKPGDLQQVKVCDKCRKSVPFNFTKCYLCDGTTFSYTQVTGAELAKLAPPESPEPLTKICPFCAEEVKFQAIKCRYCGSTMN